MRKKLVEAENSEKDLRLEFELYMASSELNQLPSQKEGQAEIVDSKL